jgi:TPR repeat protein
MFNLKKRSAVTLLFGALFAAVVQVPAVAADTTRPGSEEAERYRQACIKGIPNACTEFAIRTRYGAGGVNKDLAEAARLYQKGCDGDDAAACLDLSQMYYSGEGVVQDFALSAVLAKKACEGGNATGCSGIGMALRYGQGIAMDLARSGAYYERACMLGDAFGCKYAQRAKLLPDVYYGSSCDAGNMSDCLTLGSLHTTGEGVSLDFARAAALYERACEGGQENACVRLGELVVRGEGVPKDPVRAVQLFQRTCNDKSVEGCVNLGSMYWNGTGVPQDTNRAAALNHQACAGGNEKGCDFMARASVAIMGTPEQQKAENDAQERENRARGAEALQRAVVVTMGDLSNHFEREAQTRADADAMLARIKSQSTPPETQRAPQSAALSERAQVVAHPVAAAAPVGSESLNFPSPQMSSTTLASSGPVEMFVFFINLGGKTVAFEGPLALSRAEGNAMKARLEGEAPGRYGAGATVDARSRGGGWCAFVYQRPGDERYIMGSETSLSTATNSMKGMVSNLKAVIHHDVVCPTNN